MTSENFYTIEQVAEQLNLHVKTVRNYVRDGKLKATRIGKSYRIARGDLEALAGPVATVPPVRRARHVEVSSVVDIDAVDKNTAYRISTFVTAAVSGARDGDAPVRVQAIYDEERARLKVIVSGSIDTTRALLAGIDAMAEP
ncbi:MAG TPA: helix-turn-helix domain-containing protein [Rhizomicrobium sp.]|jgi:excisionase family DNA binding protein|nr:helix-turn-helix domain-containing protein [Rhizomicrobium sp.]